MPSLRFPTRFAASRALARATFASALLFSFASAGLAPAQAAGDETVTVPTCRKGEVYDRKSKRCVKQSSSIPDADRTIYAYALAKAGRFEEALGVLDTLANPNTAEALNYRGYATRKLGRTEEGISYYLRSVALAPDYSLVREYLGEAYVIQGRLDLATDQLRTIETLCGTGCEAYRDLSEAIAAAPKA